MDSLVYILPIVPVALVLGFLYPHACCAFLLAGSTPYFAFSEWGGVPWSTELTATVYATASVAAVAGLIAKNSHALGRLGGAVPILAIVYMVFWIWRRVLEPPVLPGTDPAPYIMLVYGLLAFLPGVLVTDENCWHKIVDWTAAFGLLTTAILVLHWATGTTGSDPGRWLPVRNLTGIVISLELGIGFLAFRHALARRKRVVWVSWLLLIVTLALMSKLAERGPLLFFVLAVGFDAYIRGNRTGLRRPLFVVAALGVVALGLYISTELAPTRATDAGKYGLESNADRMDLFSAGLSAFTERPLWGWGGSLVGRIVNGEEWWYVHSAYLDPLIDTGVAGALIFGSMLAFLALGVRRSWIHVGGAGGVAVSLLPLFLLVGLEAQVSGTVWSTRHLWFLTGVLAVLDPSSRLGFVSPASTRAPLAAWSGPGTARVTAPWQSFGPSGKGR